MIGPPGCGKTTALLDRVETALAEGIDPDRIAVVTFTRKGANEAAERAVKRFGFSRDDFPHFRTLHSLAFKHLGLTREQVMQPSNWHELGASLGPFTFQNTHGSEEERAAPQGGLGDLCLAVYGLARATGRPLEETWRALQRDPNRYGYPTTASMSWANVKTFADALSAYKLEKNLLDFTDFMDECQIVLDIDLMIVDEAQDLTPQQWTFARRVGMDAKEVLIGGDDDQSIFEWSGAAPDFLLSLRGSRRVLPVSYRLPRSVHALCNRVADRIRRRMPKSWKARDAQGLVKFILSEEQVDLKKGTWLLLARTRYLTQRLVTLCRRQGVVYKVQDDGWSNEHEQVRAVLSYEHLRRGDRISERDARLAADYASAVCNQSVDGEIGWDEVRWPFAGRPDWMTALPLIGTSEREYIRALKRNHESLTHTGRIIISTIHGAKGGEADNVLLLNQISPIVRHAVEAGTDEEHRVWYVGLSRAREKLYVVEDQSGYKF